MPARAHLAQPAHPAPPRRLLGLASPVGLHLVATAVLAWASVGSLQRVAAPGSAPLDALLGVTAAAGAWAALTWLACGVLVSVVATLRRTGVGGTGVGGVGVGGTGVGGSQRASRRHDLVCGPVARRLAAVLLGVTLGAGSGAALPAQAQISSSAAQPVASPSAGADQRAAMPQSLRGWTPDRPAAPPRQPNGEASAVLAVTAPHRARAESEDVVVRRGDTLWGIVARHLGPDATAADVVVEWPRWYAANSSTIGTDPDLLLPGQRLEPPGIHRLR